MPTPFWLSCLVVVGIVTIRPHATHAAPPLRLLTWNVESEGADPDIIAEQLQQFEPYHVYGLTEVGRSDLRRYVDAIGHRHLRRYQSIHTSTGYEDRLEIIFDAQRLELIESRELFVVGAIGVNDPEWRHRSPLVAKFRDRVTHRRFVVVLNHLARGDAELRTQQARGLTNWAMSRKKLPIIAIGDFNFDYDFSSATGNAGFVEFQRGETWRWVRPVELVDSNWADHDGDGNDDYPGSLLDFAFVAGPAKSWPATSRVIVRHNDFPDNLATSDHRPVELILSPPMD